MCSMPSIYMVSWRPSTLVQWKIIAKTALYCQKPMSVRLHNERRNERETKSKTSGEHCSESNLLTCSHLCGTWKTQCRQVALWAPLRPSATLAQPHQRAFYLMWQQLRLDFQPLFHLLCSNQPLASECLQLSRARYWKLLAHFHVKPRRGSLLLHWISGYSC